MGRCWITLALLMVLAPAACAREIAVMVTLEGVSIHQLASWQIPEIDRLVESGAVGLMNNKSDGTQVFENNAVTISAGTRSTGREFSELGFNASEVVDGETARRIFELNTGIKVPPTAVVHTGIAAIMQLNAAKRYEVIPGLLGTQLQDAGVSVAVYGNSDQDKTFSRNAVVIAMNWQGWVEIGDVGPNTTIVDQDRPFGMRTNYEYLLQSIKGLPDKSFAVVEAGDGRRIDAWKPYLLPARYEQFKRITAQECAHFLVEVDEHLKATCDRYLLLFVVTAQAPDPLARGDRLTPLVLTGTEISPGLLTSNTTRRPGLIANLDLAPTVSEFFEVTPHPSMLGRPIRSAPNSDPVAFLTEINDRMVATFNARTPVLTGYVGFMALSVLLTILSVVLHGRPNRWLPNSFYLRVLFISLILVPLALLIAPGFGIYPTGQGVGFTAGVSLMLSYALNRWIREPRLIFGLAGILVAGTICADLLFGQTLLRKSMMSYDPIAGLRLYGIGNECSGVLIGATLLGLYSIFDYKRNLRRFHLVIGGFICAGVIFMLGAPTLGTNFGGMIAALAGFSFALLKTSQRVTLRNAALWIGMGAVILFIVLMAANMMIEPEKQSHIGRAFEQAKGSNGTVLMDIAVRKWSMNLRLMRYSVWTFVLLSVIIGLAVLFWRPVGILKDILRKHPLMNAGFMGILAGVIVAMVTNDSGIAMAATGSMYLGLPLMFLVQVEMEESREASELPAPKPRLPRK